MFFPSRVLTQHKCAPMRSDFIHENTMGLNAASHAAVAQREEERKKEVLYKEYICLKLPINILACLPRILLSFLLSLQHE